MAIRDARAVLAQIDGWEGASITVLPGGLNNRNFQLDNGSVKAVLKIDDGPRELPFNSRAEEARVQQQAADAGLAAAVLFVDNGILLSEYLEGDVGTEASLADNAALEKLARALRSLHSLPLTGRSFDAAAAAWQYAQRVPADEAATAHDCLALINAMPRLQNLCCCHNDLVVGNIIATPSIRFIDWEYACDNDPFFDLATIVAHHRLDAERTRFLLDAYFDGDGERWHDRLSIQVKFYNALLWLWLKAHRNPPDASAKLTSDSATP
ncbi:MAG: phosphotransferase [Gammaproteobacteria bacterium]|nr:phosphotransferase [Gammaproteobacteria bacterium]